jgi:hypothetical protein
LHQAPIAKRLSHPRARHHLDTRQHRGQPQQQTQRDRLA